MHMFCDVSYVLVMLLSAARKRGPVCFRGRGAGFGFVAAAAFFSSLCFFLSAFCFSSLSFFSALSRISFTDCSSVNTRENVVEMPPRRFAGWAGATRSGGGVNTDETVAITGGGDKVTGAEGEEMPKTGGGVGAKDGRMIRDESSNNSRASTPCLYTAGVILVRSKGKMPAFSKPLMQLIRAVAFSHAQRVAFA